MSSASTPSTAPGVASLSSVAAHSALLASTAAGSAAAVLLFTAAWHPPCKQMRDVCSELSKKYTHTKFAEIDAEALSDVTELYTQVESVPTAVIVLRGAVVATVAGANAAELSAAVQKHCARLQTDAGAAVAAATPGTAAVPAAAATAATPESKEELDARLSQLVRASPVMAFIKGTKEAPRCGFTKKLLALFAEKQIEFGTFDILGDSVVREGLKAFSNWPTYPQVYISGELVGGLDVVKELADSGELADMIPAGHIAPSADAQKEQLHARLKQLVTQKRVVLFMKGSPAAPQCGFSSKAVAMLAAVECTDFASFDIFSDEAVREGLKEFSNWPTFPQLYVDGELVGGLDVMSEMKESGELQELLNAPPPLEAK